MDFLYDTNIVVSIAFAVFIGILFFLGVPGKIAGMLDKRAQGIRDDLDEARSLREEAQSLLASYERKQKEVADQADAIVKAAKQEAEIALEEGKKELALSIERRLAAATDQIASAEAAAVHEVKDRAVQISVAAASDLLAKKMTANADKALIDEAIKDVGVKLH